MIMRTPNQSFHQTGFNRRRTGNASIELVLILPLTMVILLLFFWMTRSFSAKHGSNIESSRNVQHNALIVERTGNDSTTGSIPRLRHRDLEYFLSKWGTNKSIQKGLVDGDGEMDPGEGVLPGQQGLGSMQSEDWLLTDTWQKAFIFPKNRREQPMMELPKEIQSILPQAGGVIQPNTFRPLLNF
jgi:hypothetical protein